MVPHQGRWAEEDLAGGGGDLTWYEGEEIDVSPMLRERMLLALPTLPLCREGCRGLCAQCGRDLNAGPCDCARGGGRPALRRTAHLETELVSAQARGSIRCRRSGRHPAPEESDHASSQTQEPLTRSATSAAPTMR